MDRNQEGVLRDFEQVARNRRAVRHFRPDRIDPSLLRQLLDIAHWAPSGYNLQPVHFVVVTQREDRTALRRACMDQSQIEEAPVIVVLTGDRRVVENQFEDIVLQEREAGAIDTKYERLLRKYVGLAFGQGPVGLGWLWKASLIPLMRIFTPIPSMPAIHKEYWLLKQVALAAMNLMLAAQAAGLGSCPMEGFDERRLKRALGIPRSHIAPIVIPIGIAADAPDPKTRLPLDRFLHFDRW